MNPAVVTRLALRSIFFAVAALLAATRVAAAEERPNILFIMSDDHAAHAIGAYGGRLAPLNPTPTIDRLAREGMRLKNVFCTNSICTPSRATIITGQYSHRNGVTTLNGSVPVARQTLAHEMKNAGYEAAIIGKWHLEAEPGAFDYYCVLPGQGSYFNPIFHAHPDTAKFLPPPLKRELPQPLGTWPKNTFRVSAYDNIHADDAITDISIAWLKNRRAKDKPFFLMHHFKGPHDNFENAERYDFLYDTTKIPEPESLRQRGNHGPIGQPLYGTSVSKRNPRRNMGHHMFVDRNLPDERYVEVSYQRYLKKYLRTVRGIDDNIARLLAHLAQTGELDNTIIVYTADQGFMLGEHDYIDKRWMYEESLRMPFIVRYPKTIRAGSTSDAIINNVDFAPTLLDFAGARATADMQGRSFRGILETGHAPADWPTATYYRYWMHFAHHDNPAHYGIRTRDFKLIFFYGLPLDAPGAEKRVTPPHWELYDLRADPHEMNNLYADPAHAETVRELKAQLAQLKQQVGDTDEKYPELLKRLAETK
jgi:arylsulfatase A-like enzyme